MTGRNGPNSAFRIPEEMKAKAQARAASEGKTLTGVIVGALTSYVAEPAAAPVARRGSDWHRVALAASVRISVQSASRDGGLSAPDKIARLLQLADVLSDEHGTRSTYETRKCRCERCRAANAARSVAVRSQRKADRTGKEKDPPASGP